MGGADLRGPFQLKHLMFHEIRVNVAMEMSERICDSADVTEESPEEAAGVRGALPTPPPPPRPWCQGDTPCAPHGPMRPSGYKECLSIAAYREKDRLALGDVWNTALFPCRCGCEVRPLSLLPTAAQELASGCSWQSRDKKRASCSVESVGEALL